MKKHIPVVVPYTPVRLSERLSAQQGGFLVPRDVTKPFMDNLNAMGGIDAGVLKLLIPNGHWLRGTILERLREMNIQRASLFPGLEGYAQSFRTMLLREPDYLRGARQALADRPKGEGES
jgi:hypothetical protein